MTQTTLERQTMSASTLMGDTIRNPKGEELGTLSEIMLDMDSGRVAYAVLDMGGFLGFGNKLFAMPWSMLTLDPETHTFVLDMPRERLERAPGFDKDEWPDFSNREWATTIHTYYGVNPYWI
jgi:sporulation protein YlmC with PRC-barrel domain